MINNIDALRALAGVAASESMPTELKERATALMNRIMDAIDDNLRFEASMMVKAKAEMNGIIS